MKCQVCNIILAHDYEVHGSITEWLCFACWHDREAVASETVMKGIENLSQNQRDRLGTVKKCNRCVKSKANNGDGSLCPVCKGSKTVTYEICDECDGSGELEHLCDCQYCNQTVEDCGCLDGLVLRPYRHPKVRESKLKTYWVNDE